MKGDEKMNALLGLFIVGIFGLIGLAVFVKFSGR
jgi:hypothetical protein